MRLGQFSRAAGGGRVVIKSIPKETVRTISSLRHLKHEVCVLRELRDARARPRVEGGGAAAEAAAEGLTHVARLIDVRLSPMSLHIVQQVGGSNLHQLTKIGGPLSAPVVAAVARGLAAALVAVHDLGWCHRDVKPENLLLGAEAIDLHMLARTDPEAVAGHVRVRLCSFGIAVPLPRAGEPRLHQMCGTSGFFAPEVSARLRSARCPARSRRLARGLWGITISALVSLTAARRECSRCSWLMPRVLRYGRGCVEPRRDADRGARGRPEL